MARLIFRRDLLLGVVVSSVIAGTMATCALAAPKTVNIPLSGATEVPPVQGPGKGTAMLAYDPDTRALSWTLEFSDLTGPATMAHFHGPAMPGANAPPVIWINKKGEAPVSPVKGEAILTPEQASDFTTGKWYVNVHTSNNPSGEIRGLIPPIK
jgi:hypothetical protein